ncbi:unnamed protein product [Periconia digitata]|uniref:Uncharacterized protein n=1 Tax=Periconia digitata TaxID=1303443 RepID=A0A9W4XH18_9PLEO|nr:unnamed protein product [Periconia digitata]
MARQQIKVLFRRPNNTLYRHFFQASFVPSIQHASSASTNISPSPNETSKFGTVADFSRANNSNSTNVSTD